MPAKISISGETQRRTRTRRWFPQEYKDQVLAWYFDSGKPVALAAEELGLSESTLRDWIRRATRATTESSSAVPEEATVEDAEVDMEIAWHGEPEEPYEAPLNQRADATWVYSPARLEALLAGSPAIAEVAYKLGVSESSVKAWVRSAAGELEADTTVSGDDSLPSELALDLEPAKLELETEATVELGPKAALELEPEATTDPQPIAVAMDEAAFQAGEVAVDADEAVVQVDEMTFEAGEHTVQADEVTVQRTDETLESAEEPAPAVHGELDAGGPWTLVWRPPAQTEGGPTTAAVADDEWVYASGWTMSQARSAALALLGSSEAEIEVECVHVPRHRIGGRVHVRARRRTALGSTSASAVDHQA